MLIFNKSSKELISESFNLRDKNVHLIKKVSDQIEDLQTKFLDQSEELKKRKMNEEELLNIIMQHEETFDFLLKKLIFYQNQVNVHKNERKKDKKQYKKMSFQQKILFEKQIGGLKLEVENLKKKIEEKNDMIDKLEKIHTTINNTLPSKKLAQEVSKLFPFHEPNEKANKKIKKKKKRKDSSISKASEFDTSSSNGSSSSDNKFVEEKRVETSSIAIQCDLIRRKLPNRNKNKELKFPRGNEMVLGGVKEDNLHEVEVEKISMRYKYWKENKKEVEKEYNDKEFSENYLDDFYTDSSEEDEYYSDIDENPKNVLKKYKEVVDINVQNEENTEGDEKKKKEKEIIKTENNAAFVYNKFM